MVTMSQNHSLMQRPQLVPWALTPDSLSVLAALRVLTGSSILALIGTFIVGANLDVDTLSTELPAAALLALVSFLAMMAVKTRLPLYYGFAGLSLGALILTKGAFFYVSLGLITCLVLWSFFQWCRSVQVTALGPVLFVLGILLVIGPWVARNYSISGDLVITERGGGVLLIRALQDQMNRTEYLGSFYVWAPNGWIKRTVGNVLGFGRDDLKRGGRLQRLNRSGRAEFAAEDRAAYSAGLPEAAISYYRRAGAEWQKIYLQLWQQGHPHPESAAEQEVQKRAVELIRAHPLRHIAMTLPFLWRGAPFIAPLLALFALAAMLWRRYDLIVYMLPAIGSVAFHAFATHNLPRYNAPAWPIITVLAVVLAQVLAFRIWQRFSQTGGQGNGILRAVLYRFSSGA
jgi:4-amino-4-deoxy-L-arabinose transferase-like glycosyltransferase